jgi:hypothetical protein
MCSVDLQDFVTTFNAELRQFHPKWDSRIDAGAKPKSAGLWAEGYLLLLDLIENQLEPGEPGGGGRKYDQIRMAILRQSREILDEATYRGDSPQTVKTRLWQSDESGNETRWRGESGTEITMEQVFSAVRREFSSAIEERPR